MKDSLLARVLSDVSMKDFYFHCMKHAYCKGGRFENFLRRFEK